MKKVIAAIILYVISHSNINIPVKKNARIPSRSVSTIDIISINFIKYKRTR